MLAAEAGSRPRATPASEGLGLDAAAAQGPLVFI